jgi:4'-phosphopantetheinyl transferase
MSPDGVDVWVCRDPVEPSRVAVRRVLEHYSEAPRGALTSLSHTEGVLLVAVSAGCRVGVDVEVIRDRGVRDLPRHVLTRREQVELARRDRAGRLEAFLSYWTRKEALLKAAGVGLALEPQLIELPPPGSATHVVAVPDCLGGAERWSVTQLELEGFAAAVAAETPSPRIRMAELVTAA